MNYSNSSCCCCYQQQQIIKNSSSSSSSIISKRRRRRRVYTTYLIITILQILTTIARQVFDFFGPLWTTILTNFLSIVFSIFGYYGVYIKSNGYIATYLSWTLLHTTLNIIIFLLYTYHPLSNYKSFILSLNTGSLSWFETRAPGCIPDWSNEIIYNCYIDPILIEGGQAILQVILGLGGIVTGVILICSNNKSSDLTNVIAMGPIATPITDLRPMTPRRVKRRSARSIQSQHFGKNKTKSRTSNHSIGAVNSISRQSRHSSNHSNQQQQMKYNYISPVNRLINDSETSYDEGGGHPGLLLGIPNRGYISSGNHRNQQQQLININHSNNSKRELHQKLVQQQQSPSSIMYNQRETMPINNYHSNVPPPIIKPPPRPPSARSSYSNYHPARLGLNNLAYDHSNDEQFYNNKSTSVYPLAHSPAISLNEIENYPLSSPNSYYSNYNQGVQQISRREQQQMMRLQGQQQNQSPRQQIQTSTPSSSSQQQQQYGLNNRLVLNSPGAMGQVPRTNQQQQQIGNYSNSNRIQQGDGGGGVVNSETVI